jgi:hypothetical protein
LCQRVLLVMNRRREVALHLYFLIELLIEKNGEESVIVLSFCSVLELILFRSTYQQ